MTSANSLESDGCRVPLEHYTPKASFTGIPPRAAPFVPPTFEALPDDAALTIALSHSFAARPGVMEQFLRATSRCLPQILSSPTRRILSFPTRRTLSFPTHETHPRIGAPRHPCVNHPTSPRMGKVCEAGIRPSCLAVSLAPGQQLCWRRVRSSDGPTFEKADSLPAFERLPLHKSVSEQTSCSSKQ